LSSGVEGDANAFLRMTEGVRVVPVAVGRLAAIRNVTPTTTALDVN
jgi:hypothetical protein